MVSSAGRRDPRRSLADLRVVVAERLLGRQEEIEEAVVHRALSVAPPTGREAPGYVDALRAAIPAAVECAFGAIELGEERIGPTPEAIHTQAAASARSKVGLEVVLRRYAAGYSTLSDFLHQEVRALAGAPHPGYVVLQRDLTALFDRLVVEVSEAYRREEASDVPSQRQRRLERIRRLLAGELVDPAGLDYPLGGTHLAIIISGEDAEATAARLAEELDRRLLLGESSAKGSAVWLGGARGFETEEVETATSGPFGEGLRLSFGEPGEGLAGWRRSRRQAEAAHLVVGRGVGPVVRYREVALEAAALRDPDLAHFLTEAYVAPFEDDRSSLVPTLRSFLELDRNVSSAAAALGVTRQTVTSRLRAAEERLGRPLEQCAAQLETALRLAELDG
jgi:PucR C-terminal helix-turn-helix domain